MDNVDHYHFNSSAFMVCCWPHSQTMLIWQGSVCVGLQDMGLDLSRRDSAETMCDEVW